MIQRWFERSKDQWNGFRAIPLGRLWVLLAGAFLLFLNQGYYYDLRHNGTLPYLVVFTIGTISGLNTVLWILTVRRFSLTYIVPMIAVQPFLGKLYSLLDTQLTQMFHLQPVPSSQGIPFSGGGMFWTAVAGYVVLLRFVRREGNESLTVQAELGLAHRIQETLVPVVSIRTQSFEIYGLTKPSEKVGGDLVDAVLLPDGDAIAYLTDIAGHGLAASIFMGRLKTALRTALIDAQTFEPIRTLPSILERLSVVLPQVRSDNMYATFTGFRLNADGGVFFAQAASPPILHWQAETRAIASIQVPELPLGLLPVTHYDGHEVTAKAGDLLVVATDGLLEVCDRNSEELGVERLSSLVEANSSAPLPDLANKILDTALKHGPQQDDQTLLLIRAL